MHGNSDVEHIACFSAFFAQARQSSLSEVAWKPESCSQVQFRPDERCFALVRKYFRPSEGMVAKAKIPLLSGPISLKREDFHSSERDSRSS